MAKRPWFIEDQFGEIDRDAFREAVIEELGRDNVHLAKVSEILNWALDHSEFFPYSGAVTVARYAAGWARRLVRGIERRATSATQTGMNTIPDELIDSIVENRLIFEDVDNQAVALIREAHRFSMGVENLVGGLLEEYIDSVASNYGWVCCWGSSLRAVDFLRPDDSALIQIKNRSNSENSSSRAIRSGKEIISWFRIDADTGETKWESLNETLGSTELSEEGFRAFIQVAVQQNRDIVFVSNDLLTALTTVCQGTKD